MAREQTILVQLSDQHMGAVDMGGDPVRTLEEAVRAVELLPLRSDAVLLSGDLTDNGAHAEYEAVREIVGRLGVPIHVLPGNHDERAAMRRVFGLPGSGAEPISYAADIGDLRLVVLDGTRPGSEAGELDDARLQELDAQLAAAPDRATVLATHHPPVAIKARAWDEIGIPATDRDALAAVLERHPQVQLILAGHVHRTVVGALAGRPVLVAPSTHVATRFDLADTEIELEPAAPRAFAVHALIDGEIRSHVLPVDRGGPGP
jgi:3',5'-cyclic AMP phosphodiesterase CpdA